MGVENISEEEWDADEYARRKSLYFRCQALDAQYMTDTYTAIPIYSLRHL